MSTKKKAKKQGKMGRFKASNLHKVLPEETIKGIKEGNVDLITKTAQDLAVNRVLCRFGSYDDTAKEAPHIMFRSIATGLAKMAFGAPGSEKDQDHRVSIAIVKLAKSLWSAFADCILASPSGEMVHASQWIALVKACQGEHDSLLASWSHEIFQITGHGPVDNSCAYQTTFDHFKSVVEEFGLPHVHNVCEDFENELKHATLACAGVAAGLGNFRETCWECDKYFEGVQKCTGCKAARYCSSECQKKSWKGGHKTKCKILEKQYQALQSNEKVISKAVKAGSIALSSTIQPNPHMDSMVLGRLFNFLAQLGGKDVMNLSTDGSYMTKAYEAIQDIQNGGRHFALVDSNTKKTSNTEAVQDIRDDEVDYILTAIFAMAVVSRCESQGVNLPDPDGPDGLRAAFEARLGDGKLMTTERFLEIYKNYVDTELAFHEISDLCNWDFRDYKLFAVLRDEHHK